MTATDDSVWFFEHVARVDSFPSRAIPYLLLSVLGATS